MEQPWAVILAAGEGTRMHSALPKVLHPLCGKPLLWHVLQAAKGVTKKQVLAVGRGAEQIRDYFGAGYLYAEQEERLGTGHALQQVLPHLPTAGEVLVLCGDTPLLESDVLKTLLSYHRRQRAAATVLTASLTDPRGYGRMIRDEEGRLEKIVEEQHLAPGQQEIGEINTGCYCFDLQVLQEYLPALPRNEVKGEYYLTDLLPLLIRDGKQVGACLIDDARLALGINDRVQLAAAASYLRQKINARLMRSGVTMIDPASTYIDAGVEVGRDTVLYPQCILEGETVVGKNCRLGPGLHLVNTNLEDDVHCQQALVIDSVLKEGANVGPFVHIRPQSTIGAATRIGNFVEVKNSFIGRASKVPHLSYVGDTQMEPDVNMGAGTIVVNYDGRRKHVTHIEEGAFVGCNSNLVAPVKIGRGAFVAAGSTITGDVPSDALAICRSKQEIREGLGKRLLKRKKEENQEK